MDRSRPFNKWFEVENVKAFAVTAGNLSEYELITTSTK